MKTNAISLDYIRKIPSAYDVLEALAYHLSQQGKKAQVEGAPGDGMKCVYRAPIKNALTITHTTCAVGLFIPDELYNPSMENKGFASLLSQVITMQVGDKAEAYNSLRLFFENHADLLSICQQLHDNWPNTDLAYLISILHHAKNSPHPTEFLAGVRASINPILAAANG